MVSECSSVIPELKSQFHFSWCVLNMNKHCEGRKVRSAKAVHPKRGLLGWLWKRLGSGLYGNGLLHSLLWRSEGTFGSSWSLTERWEADWKKTGKFKKSVVVNFELNKALWILSPVQMQVSPRCWFALFFSVKKIDSGVASGLSSRLSSTKCGGAWTRGVPSGWAGQLIAWDTSPTPSVCSFSFLPSPGPKGISACEEKQLWWVAESRGAGGLVSCLGDERLNLEILFQFRQSRDDLHRDPLVWWLPE